MKKILSTAFIACLCTCLLMGNSAHAAVFGAFPDVPMDADYATAVETLAAAGIIKGDAEGKFNPDSSITRAEVATIICRLLNGVEEAAKLQTTTFDDVPTSHWANQYIAYAEKHKVIGGYGNGNFGPQDTVTYEQMAKMLVCAWGWETIAVERGGWPSGYLSVANEYGYTRGISHDPTTAVSRKHVALLTYNSLY